MLVNLQHDNYLSCIITRDWLGYVIEEIIGDRITRIGLCIQQQMKLLGIVLTLFGDTFILMLLLPTTDNIDDPIPEVQDSEMIPKEE